MTIMRLPLITKNRLFVPELIDARGGERISIEMRRGGHMFFPGVESETMGYNGDYLGPTIRIYKNTTVKIAFKNLLGEDTTVHSHGLLVRGEIDGGPQAKIGAGLTWEIAIPVRQEAGTSWYHPHLMGKTAEQVYKGLAGVYLIEDENSMGLGLPREYGVNDIPLVVQDRNFVNKKMKPYAVDEATMTTGARGNAVVVNGTVDAYKEVPRGWVRLRLLNGANARLFEFFFNDDTTFYQIATEGGFLDKPLPLQSLMMAPGERNEIMVNFSDGIERSLMARFLPDAGIPVFLTKWIYPKKKVATFRVDGSLQAEGSLPKRLNRIVFFKREQGQRAREFDLQMGDGDGDGGGGGGGMMNMFSINGKSMDLNTINERVKKGVVEIWRVTGNEMLHPFHIHGVSFQILSRNGEAPGAHERGWKDTAVVGGDGVTELIMRFGLPATKEYPYMYHCHILEHEDGGMMGQFTVE